MKNFIINNLMCKTGRRLNGNLLKSNIEFWKNHKDEYEILLEVSKSNQGGKRQQSPLNEACYRILHDITGIVKCHSPTCNNPVNYHTFCTGYHKYCSKKCAGSGEYNQLHICTMCGNEFKSSSPSSLYCSEICQNGARDERLHDKPFSKNRGIISTHGEVKSLLNFALICEICEKPFTNEIRKNVDHDHLTGKVRGILCDNCNLGLGHFADSISALQNAVLYLSKHNEEK